MDFLLIMGIGTVVAIIVVAFQPRSGQIICEQKNLFARKMPRNTLASQKDLSEVVSTDGLDYLRKQARHMNDPRHWPAPLPPPQVKRPGYETDYTAYN